MRVFIALIIVSSLVVCGCAGTSANRATPLTDVQRPGVDEVMVDIDGDTQADGYDATFWIPVADTGLYRVEARLTCTDGSVIDQGRDMSLETIRHGGTTSLFSRFVEIHVDVPGGVMPVWGFMPSHDRLTSCRPPFHYVVEASRGYWVADPVPSAPDNRRWVSVHEQWWSIPSKLRGDERFVFSGFLGAKAVDWLHPTSRRR